jgi:Zn-dependent protease
MSWERHDAEPGNPLGWSLPLLPVAGIRFRLHFTFALYAVAALLMASAGPAGSTPVHGAVTTAYALAALLVVVLVREVARALVVRAAGGGADEVMLWPLGSLQGIDPAPGWVAALLAAVVGPAASALLAAACGIALGFATGDWHGAALPDPLSASWLSNPHPTWIELLWILHWTGIQVALLSLIPMLPLDGGRALEAIIVRRRGAFDAPRLAAIACAGFAAFSLWKLRAGDSIAASQGGWRDPAPSTEPDDADSEARRRAGAERESRAAEDRALDAILEKIAREGADRLTDAERAILARATDRRRSGGR